MGVYKPPAKSDKLRDLLCLFHHIHFDTHRVDHCGHGEYQIEHCGCKFCDIEVQHAINKTGMVVSSHLPIGSTLYKYTFIECCPKSKGWYHIASSKTLVEDVKIFITDKSDAQRASGMMFDKSFPNCSNTDCLIGR